LFAQRGQPDHVEVSPADHGCVETRRIWCSTRLNDYLTFPHVAQVFLIEREVFIKKTARAEHGNRLVFNYLFTSNNNSTGFVASA
jgi:hypothetical protein